MSIVLGEMLNTELTSELIKPKLEHFHTQSPDISPETDQDNKGNGHHHHHFNTKWYIFLSSELFNYVYNCDLWKSFCFFSGYLCF